MNQKRWHRVTCLVCGLQADEIETREYAEELAKAHTTFNQGHICQVDDGRETVHTGGGE